MHEENYIMSRKTTQTTSKDAIVQIWTFAKMEKNFHFKDILMIIQKLNQDNFFLQAEILLDFCAVGQETAHKNW